ncbi:hypothetical protein CPC08DRAFT_751874 [Agrocybe pediades]|nr:hypothetical protein CPC08DRAFT_751874 [Agrocybe pediades]
MPMDRSAIIEAGRLMRLFSYVWVSATVFLLCDNLSTLDLEVKMVDIQSRLLPPEVLRFFYDGPLRRCLCHGTALGDEMPAVLLVCGDGVRCDNLLVHALYDRSTRILWLLALLYLGNVVLQYYVSVTVGLDAARTIFIAPTGLPLPGCLSNPDPKLNLPALISSMVVTSIHMTLLLVAWYRAYYTSRQLGMPFRFSPVMKALVRDGIAFFLLRAAIVISFTVMNFVIVRGPLLTVMLPWYNAAYISIGCRLILNIRKVAHTHGEALARGDSFVFGGLETSLTIGREFHGNTDVRHDENNC